MRLALAGWAALLCTLPAHGDELGLPQSVVHALTPIDAQPTQSALNQVFATPQLALENLRSIALDRSLDLGIQLRAIRALPAYCPPAPQACGPGTPVHDTLIMLITSQQLVQHTPKDQLRLRAAIEALGATRSKLVDDVNTLMPLLGNGSRDVRATVVRALLNICNTQAIGPLTRSYSLEQVAQVRAEISAAIQDLHQCTE